MLTGLYTAVWPKPVNCATILQNFKTYETTGRIVTPYKILKKIRLHSALQFINFGLKSRLLSKLRLSVNDYQYYYQTV